MAAAAKTDILTPFQILRGLEIYLSRILMFTGKFIRGKNVVLVRRWRKRLWGTTRKYKTCTRPDDTRKSASSHEYRPHDGTNDREIWRCDRPSQPECDRRAVLAQLVRWQLPVIFSRQNKHRWKLRAAQWLKASRQREGRPASDNLICSPGTLLNFSKLQ